MVHSTLLIDEAKWKLVSPNGDIVTVSNLREWVRQNIYLFDIDDNEHNIKKVTDSFVTIKWKIKKTSKRYTYKGWTVIP